MKIAMNVRHAINIAITKEFSNKVCSSMLYNNMKILELVSIYRDRVRAVANIVYYEN